MDNAHKPTFSVVIWIILGGIYIFSLWWFGVTVGNGIQIFLDIVAFFLGISLWKFFFSQFILPVLTLENRKQISQRLSSGSDGPALFIENGYIVESGGERDKSGKGVILLDTASAVVLKKLTHFTQTAGPGVVFTEKGESIAESIDLHKQSDSLGPRLGENPFAAKKDAQSDKEYEAIQERRFETSALTRDGIEVVPSIVIKFKIDADPAMGCESGSRFGYDEEAVRKAVWYTGINPDIPATSRYHDVGWNQLPVYLAADLWREYLSKHKFEELFEAIDIPDYKGECPETMADSPSSFNETLPPVYGPKGIFIDWYRFWGSAYQNLAEKCNKQSSAMPTEKKKEGAFEEKNNEKDASATENATSLKKETALGLIERLINQRLKELCYDKVDAYGKSLNEKERSLEYDFLKNKRGIRVLNVGIQTLRFDSTLDEKLQESWTANWYEFAKKEESVIKKEEEIRKLRGKEKAHFEYALALSRDVVNGNAKKIDEILEVLLRSTRKEMVRNNQLLELNEKKNEENNVDIINDIEDLRQRINTGDEYV